MFDAVRHSATCVNLLRDMSSAAKLRPSELRSAGAVIERMRAVNFTDDKIRVVIKALFCLDHMSRNEARRQLEMAFDVWDAGHRGYLTVDEFERDLQLMHAELTPEEIKQLVSGYDLNGSGELDFEAFRAPRPCLHARPRHCQHCRRPRHCQHPRAGEIMTSLAAHHDEDEGKVKKLKRAAEDTALAVRTLGVLATGEGTLADFRKTLPVVLNTPELRFTCSEERKFVVPNEVHERLKAEGADVNATDGVRVNTPDGWWLLRASNTQDVLVARCEAMDEAGLGRLKGALAGQLAASGVELPAGF